MLLLSLRSLNFRTVAKIQSELFFPGENGSAVPLDEGFAGFELQGWGRRTDAFQVPGVVKKVNIQDLVARRRFTVLLGKNGSGKSTLLRKLDSQGQLNTRYITPERGGVLKYEPGIDNNLRENPSWLVDTRRRNRFESFRQQSAAQFRNLEVLFLRALEKDPQQRADLNHTFDRVLDELNDYLPAIRLVRSERGFSIQNRQGTPIPEDQISSGEAEFVAQAIELLVYSRDKGEGKTLLLDEPDAHLHPDLQSRFVRFIEKTAVDYDLRVVVATHSTAIVSGFSREADLQIVPVMARTQVEFQSFSRTAISEQLLPIFGIHPLSSLFTRSPIVLVEGEDDRRVLEQFVRSSGGRTALTPCVVGTVDEMARWEVWLETFLPAIYDEPRAYSLRDRDGANQAEIDDLACVVRARLECYAIENVLLCTQSLARAGCDSGTLLERLRSWDPNHPLAPSVAQLAEEFQDRRNRKIKDVRNIVTALLGITKPWEVHIGQVLADAKWGSAEDDHSLVNYVGSKAKRTIFTQN